MGQVFNVKDGPGKLKFVFICIYKCVYIYT